MTSRRNAVLRSRKKSDTPIVAEVRDLIVTARRTVAAAVNASLTTLYWQIGIRIRREILRKKRAGYGEQILQTLSAELSSEFGRGFSKSNLASMVLFAELFPDEKIFQTLSGKLSWSHFIELLPLDKPHQRDTGDFNNTEALNALVQKAGGQGWELVAVARAEAVGVSKADYVCFRRAR